MKPIFHLIARTGCGALLLLAAGCNESGSWQDSRDERDPALQRARAAKNALAFKKMSGGSWRGMLHEGIAMKKEGDLKWTQVILAANTPMLLRAGLVEGRLDAGVLSSGQVAGVIDDIPSVAELIARIMSEAEQTLKRLGELA